MGLSFEMTRQYNQNSVPRSDNRAYMKEWRKRNPDQWRARRRKHYVNHPEKYMWRNARTRAKRRQVPFTIQESDIIIPEVCPILGIKLKMSIGNHSDDSPSLDCIIPELGYTPGNIAVMSWRANRMKNIWSLDELTKLVEWMRKQ